MKKVLLFIIILLFTLQFSFGQKLFSEPIRVSHINLPDAPLPKEFTNYSTSLEAAEKDLKILGIRADNYLDHYFKFNGFEKTEQHGDFHININIGQIKILPALLQMDDSGHYKSIPVIFPINYSVLDAKGNIIDEGVISNEVNYEYRRSDKDVSKLNQEWEKVSFIFTSRKLSNSLNEKMTELTSLLKNKYDFQNSNSTFNIFSIKEHEESKGFMNQLILVAKSFYGRQADKSTNDLKKELNPAFDYWKSIQKKYSNSNNKEEQSIYYAACMNLANTSYWLDMLKEAKTFCHEALKLDYDNQSAELLLKEIEHTEKEFQLNNVDSRY